MLYHLFRFASNSQILYFLTVNYSIFNLKIKIELQSGDDQLNVGTRLLRPYVASIVTHVETIVSANMSQKTLPSKPLKILARLSSFASASANPLQCEKIVQLLTVYLVKNHNKLAGGEEAELDMLTAIRHLIAHIRVEQLAAFVHTLSRLLAVVTNRRSRVELVLVFDALQQRQKHQEQQLASIESIASLVAEWNAWDARRVEEPDYTRRLDAFTRLNALVAAWSAGCVDLEVAHVLLFNSVHYMSHVDDLALKESATNSLVLFVRKVASDGAAPLASSHKNFMDSTLLAQIKTGLRNKTESARHEFIAVLAELVKHSRPDGVASALGDLRAHLLDTVDPEKCFFDNIRHIQMHRRARALKKLQRACTPIPAAAADATRYFSFY